MADKRQRAKKVTKAIALVVALVVIAASCGSEGEVAVPVNSEPVSGSTVDQTLADQLMAAQGRWQANGPASYDMVVERNCCPVSIVRSTVIDRRLMAVDVEVGPGGSRINTMEEALEEVSLFLRNDVPSEVEAVFDSETGALITFLLPFNESNELDDRRMEFSLEEATPISSVPHGVEEAQTGCPDTAFTPVAGSMFTAAIPEGVDPQEAEGVDSEVAYFGDDAFEVSWDFGSYSDPLDYWEGPFTARTVSYSGVGGRVVNAEPVAGSYNGRSVTAVHFMRVSGSANEWNGLTVMVQYRDPSLEPLAECVIASIDWR